MNKMKCCKYDTSSIYIFLHQCFFCKTAFLIKEVYRTEPSLEARVPWSKQLQSLFYKKQQGGEDVAKGIEL